MGWKRRTLVGAAAVVVATYAGLSWVTREPDRPVTRLPRSERLVITNVRIVDPRAATVTPGATIVIEAGRIVAAGRGLSPTATASGRTVDGRGRYVVPGYNDMHAHALGADDPSGSLALMLSWGITGFRQMSGSDAILAERRGSRLPLGTTAPGVLAMPGSLLTPLNASRPEQVRETVRHQKAEGADFIKAGLVDGPGLFAALDEGRRDGIPVVGHVPAGVDVVAAARAGMRSIEHLGPANGVLIACSSEPDRIRREVLAATRTPKMPAINSHIVEKLAEWALLKRVVNPAAADHEAGAVAPLNRALATYDEARCRAVIRAMKAAGNWQVPTLIRLKTIYLADDPAFARDPALRFIAPDEVDRWREVTRSFVEGYSPAERAAMRRGYEASVRLVGLMAREGMPMLAGSDSVGGGWLIPGQSLHQEFDELARAGLPAINILRMTTSDAADFLGRGATMGAVAPGRSADLVLLDGDPTRSVAALHQIAGVVRAGFYYDARQLSALRERVARGGGRLK